MSAVLELTGIKKSFKNIDALKGVNVSVPEGSIYGFLGPNGAGKSTLMRIISAYIQADDGQLRLGEKTYSAAAYRGNEVIGLVPQEIALYEDLSPRQNFQIFGQIYDLPGKTVRQRMETLLRPVELWDQRDNKIKDFSGGMKRRLNIALSLIHEPKILLCDEPTTGIDPQSRNAIFEYLESCREAGLTILYTTHYMEEAERLCDRIAIIDEGSLMADGTLVELLAMVNSGPVIHFQVPDTNINPKELLSPFGQFSMGEHDMRLKLKPDVSLAAIFGCLEGMGVSGSSIRLRQPTLEQLFLQLTGRTLRD